MIKSLVTSSLVMAIATLGQAWAGEQTALQSNDRATELLSATCRGCWADAGIAAGVTTPAMSSVAPVPPPSGNTGVNSVTLAWSGGAFDTDDSIMVVWGGGHTDYCGNEVYEFALSTLDWRRVTQPSVCPPLTADIDPYPDGRPASRHTYGNLAYMPQTHQVASVGGVIYGSAGNGSSITWLFDVLKYSWTQKSRRGGSGGGSVGGYDSADGNLYYAQGGKRGISRYNPKLDYWTSLGNGEQADYHQNGAVDSVNEHIVAVGNSHLYVYDFGGNLVDRSSSATGDETCQNYSGPNGQGAPGFVFIATSHLFVCLAPGNAALYFLDPVQWNWTAHRASASNRVIPPPESAGANGLYGRFAYDPNHDCFVYVPDYRAHVFLYRPDFTP